VPIRKKGTIYNTQAWRRLCAQIKTRDGYRCRQCGAAGTQIGGRARLTVQHLVAALVAPHLALSPMNLVTLCDVCHGKMDGGRRYRRRF
jgi:5-methylcytosine-specific restriction protein A